MVSSWKVAIRPSESRIQPSPSNPKPKRQQEIQTPKAESLNFPVAKVSTKKTQKPKELKNASFSKALF